MWKNRGKPSVETQAVDSLSDEVQWSVESTFPVHVLPNKNKYIRQHYITVSLATLADYIIEHQWE